MHEGPIGRTFTVLGKSYLHILHQKLNDLDIDRYYHTLMFIDEGNGVITQKELVSLLGSDKVSVVRMVDYLSEKGYVKRVRNKNDNRKYSLELTSKAKQAVPKIKQAFTEANNIVFRGMTDNQKINFNEILQILKLNLTGNLTSL